MFREGVLRRESKAFIKYQVYMSLIFRSHLVLACWAYPDTCVDKSLGNSPLSSHLFILPCRSQGHKDEQT